MPLSYRQKKGGRNRQNQAWQGDEGGIGRRWRGHSVGRTLGSRECRGGRPGGAGPGGNSSAACQACACGCGQGVRQRPLRERLAEKGFDLISPHRGNRQRPKTVDGRKLRRYRRRWLIERSNGWLQNFRRVVTRWEYYSFIYHG